MLAQSNLFVAAPLKMECQAELKSLLASMNMAAGRVDPRNSLVPFGEIEGLHFARFVILDDLSQNDIQIAYGLRRADYPLMLAFIAEFDGDADDFRADLERGATDGLRRIFSCCEGFNPNANLAHWMKHHEQPPVAAYVNWAGRTVRRIREDDALRLVLETYLQNNAAMFEGKHPRQIQEVLRKFVNSEQAAGRIQLTREEPTPLGWRIRKLVHLIYVPLILLAVSPLLLLYLPIFI